MGSVMLNERKSRLRIAQSGFLA